MRVENQPHGVIMNEPLVHFVMALGTFLIFLYHFIISEYYCLVCYSAVLDILII